MFKTLLITCLFAASLLAVAQEKLTPSETALVEGSKQAILATGITEPYFKAHFKLLRVVDKPSDRRVMWQFSINEHQAVINDAIGYYTQNGKQVDTHSVAKELGQTSEIRRTVTRTRALRIMKSCIGPFDTPSVTYGPVDGHAELLLVAAARTTEKNKSTREKEREREREERDKRKAVAAGTDFIESEEEDAEGGAPITLGAVNLRTGKCTKGAAVSSPFAR